MANGSRFRCLIFLCLLFAAWVEGTELQPWFGNYLEFEVRSFLFYQNYKAVAFRSNLCAHSSDDVFLDLSLSFVPKPEFSVEAEILFANTRHNHGVDNFRLTGRYMLLDDITGDPLSVTAGFTLSQAFVGSLHDISSFHHGRGEAELHIAVGRELTSDKINWNSRLWAVGALGFADRGKPWLRANVAYEYRFLDSNEFRVFTNTLWGLGTKNLKITDFDGYGSLRHQSVDLGVRYTYLIEYFGSFSLEYTRRVYAYNFPAENMIFTATVLYTFGL